MSTTKSLTDVLKAAPSVSDVTGKRLLVVDSSGNPSQVPLGGSIPGLNAYKITVTQLTDEDLNDLKTVGFTVYRGGTGNTCANKPLDSVGTFGLTCQLTGNAGFLQIFTVSASGVSYRRQWTGSDWTPWKKMLTEDDITSLIARIAALEARGS